MWMSRRLGGSVALALFSFVGACAPAGPPTTTPRTAPASFPAPGPTPGPTHGPTAHALAGTTATPWLATVAGTTGSSTPLVLADPHAVAVVDPRSGRAAYLVGRLSPPSTDPDLVIMRRFVTDHAALLGFGGPDTALAPTRARPTQVGPNRVMRFRLTWRDIPVLRQSVKVELDPEGRVVSVGASLAPLDGPLPDPTPRLDAAQATAAVTAWLAAAHPEVALRATTAPALALGPGHLVWRIGLGVVSRDEAARAHDAGHAWLVSLDAHDGAILGLADTTRSCEDGVAGTVVTSSEGLRAGIDGVPAATHPIETCESSFSDTWYLEDHRQHADIHVYDASGFSGPATAGAWFDACVQPACFAVSGDDNTWTADEFQASDYRNIERAEGYYRDVHGRDGADDSGEDIEVASGIDYDNATGMGIFRTVAFGRPVPERGLPSYGVLDVAAHELTHVVSWHEWVGLFDYGFEGTLHGVEGAVDEHMGDMIGAFVQWRSADEEWLRGLRWAFNTERMYGYNYQFHAALDAYAAIYGARNYYLGQDGYTPRAHIDQLYVGPDDGGGVHTNAVILGRAVYLYAEGGRVDADPDDRPLFGWPADAPRHRVSGIGMAKAERITYHTLVTSELVTPFGEFGLGDLEQVEQDATGMRRELERFAAIDFASCLAVAAADGWRVETCAAVRNAYAGVGLMELDGDSDGLADSLDNCRRAANADQADQDGDGVGDACDVCPTVADGDQADQDQDGVGDACACFPCAGADACALASCQHGQCVLTARVCDDRRDCTLDRCDAALGCLADPSACPCSNDADCDDHNACDGVERCGDGGTCLAGTPPGCNDGAAASIDSCAPAVGCRHIAKPGQAKLVVACLDAATECDDHNACTRDGCDPLGGCRHDLVDCDDGDTCTTDACSTVLGCQHAPVACDDGDLCNGRERCDHHAGCKPGLAPACAVADDRCAAPACDPALGCVAVAAPDGSPCDDFDRCTSEHCEGGLCVASRTPGCCTEDADCADGWARCSREGRCEDAQCRSCADDGDCGASGNRCIQLASGRHCLVAPKAGAEPCPAGAEATALRDGTSVCVASDDCDATTVADDPVAEAVEPVEPIEPIEPMAEAAPDPSAELGPEASAEAGAEAETGAPAPAPDDGCDAGGGASLLGLALMALLRRAARRTSANVK